MENEDCIQAKEKTAYQHRSMSILGGILIATAAILGYLPDIIGYLHYLSDDLYSHLRRYFLFEFFISGLLPLVIGVTLAVAFFVGKKNIFLIISTGAYALYYSFISIRNIADLNYDYYNGSDVTVIIIHLIAGIICSLCIFFFALANLVPAMSRVRMMSKKYFWLPAVIALISTSVYLFKSYMSILNSDFYDISDFFYYLLHIWSVMLNPAAVLLAALWITSSKKTNIPVGNAVRGHGFISLVKHTLLLLLTSGIWQCIWVYRTTDYLNKCGKYEYRNPTNKLLLNLFVPFYYIYWFHQSAKRVDQMLNEKGDTEKITSACIISLFIFQIASMLIIQEKINDLETSPYYSQPDPVTSDHQDQAPPVYQVPPAYNAVQDVRQDHTANEPEPRNNSFDPLLNTKSDQDIAESLKLYKELFDTGVITEEEFSAKKKQLLGI